MYRTFGKLHPQQSTLLLCKPVKAISQAPGQVSQRLRRLACIAWFSPMESHEFWFRKKGMLVIQKLLFFMWFHLMTTWFIVYRWLWHYNGSAFFQPRCQNHHSNTLVPFFCDEHRRFPKIFNIPSSKGWSWNRPRSVITFGEWCSLSSAHNRLVEPASWLEMGGSWLNRPRVGLKSWGFFRFSARSNIEETPDCGRGGRWWLWLWWLWPFW